MKVIILGLLIVILILIVGMLVLSVAAVAMAKASSAEEPAAAAQAFNEAQQEGRLMELVHLESVDRAPSLDGRHVRLVVGGRCVGQGVQR